MLSDMMNRDEVRADLTRWKEVNEVIAAELAALSPEEKFRQFESLMQSASLFAWPDSEKEDAEVREVWMRLFAIERC